MGKLIFLGYLSFRKRKNIRTQVSHASWRKGRKRSGVFLQIVPQRRCFPNGKSQGEIHDLGDLWEDVNYFWVVLEQIQGYINGHATGTGLLEVPTIYFGPIC